MDAILIDAEMRGIEHGDAVKVYKLNLQAIS